MAVSYSYIAWLIFAEFILSAEADIRDILFNDVIKEVEQKPDFGPRRGPGHNPLGWKIMIRKQESFPPEVYTGDPYTGPDAPPEVYTGPDAPPEVYTGPDSPPDVFREPWQQFPRDMLFPPPLWGPDVPFPRRQPRRRLDDVADLPPFIKVFPVPFDRQRLQVKIQGHNGVKDHTEGQGENRDLTHEKVEDKESQKVNPIATEDNGVEILRVNTLDELDNHENKLIDKSNDYKNKPTDKSTNNENDPTFGAASGDVPKATHGPEMTPLDDVRQSRPVDDALKVARSQVDDAIEAEGKHDGALKEIKPDSHGNSLPDKDKTDALFQKAKSGSDETVTRSPPLFDGQKAMPVHQTDIQVDKEDAPKNDLDARNVGHDSQVKKADDAANGLSHLFEESTKDDQQAVKEEVGDDQPAKMSIKPSRPRLQEKKKSAVMPKHGKRMRRINGRKALHADDESLHRIDARKTTDAEAGVMRPMKKRDAHKHQNGAIRANRAVEVHVAKDDVIRPRRAVDVHAAKDLPHPPKSHIVGKTLQDKSKDVHETPEEHNRPGHVHDHHKLVEEAAQALIHTYKEDQAKVNQSEASPMIDGVVVTSTKHHMSVGPAKVLVFIILFAALLGLLIFVTMKSTDTGCSSCSCTSAKKTGSSTALYNKDTNKHVYCNMEM